MIYLLLILFISHTSHGDHHLIEKNGVKIGDMSAFSVAISKDYVIVGNPLNVEQVGSVNIRENRNGYKELMAELVPDDAQAHDNFGCSVAINDKFIVIGSKRNDAIYPDQGSVYVYKIAGEEWAPEKLIAADAAEGDQFGYSVDINDEHELVVGAQYARTKGLYSGAVYIFKFTNGVWMQVQKLIPSDLNSDDSFGHSVSITKDYIAVGASHQQKNYPHFYKAGSVYIYKKNRNGWWKQDAKIESPHPQNYGYFGSSLSMYGTRVIIGAAHQNSSLGNAYLFSTSNGGWQLESELKSEGCQRHMYYGYSVAMYRDTAIVGTWYNDIRESFGLAHVFEMYDGKWMERRRLVANEQNEILTVDIHDKTVVAGCISALGENSGASYVFQFSNPTVVT